MSKYVYKLEAKDMEEFDQLVTKLKTLEGRSDLIGLKLDKINKKVYFLVKGTMYKHPLVVKSMLLSKANISQVPLFDGVPTGQYVIAPIYSQGSNQLRHSTDISVH